MNKFRHAKVQRRVTILCACLTFHSIAVAADSATDKMRELTELAVSGDPDAQFNLASAYDNGSYGISDGELAMKYYLMAANQGYAEAQNSVGSGLQAEGKYVEAFAWYERATLKNHGLATNSLAYLYDLGLGVAQNQRRAFQLYLKSASLGRAEAMWNIANIYGAGELGEEDLFNACVWTVRGLAYVVDGYTELQGHLDKAIAHLNQKLSLEELRSCDAKAGEWKPVLGEVASGSEAPGTK